MPSTSTAEAQQPGQQPAAAQQARPRRRRPRRFLRPRRSEVQALQLRPPGPGRAPRPPELDVYQLLLRFLLRVAAGAEPCLASFRETWQELRFSYVFQVGGGAWWACGWLLDGAKGVLKGAGWGLWTLECGAAAEVQGCCGELGAPFASPGWYGCDAVA